MTADTHINEPIDSKKELKGNSRRGQDAPPDVQQRVIDIIIEEAHKLKFNNRDTAYYIAIAKHESGFNPDAANSGSTASGVGQLEDGVQKKYHIDDSRRFDARSNIQAGLAYFLAIKTRIISDFGSASGDHEPLIYFCYHYGEFSVYHRHTDPKGNVIVDAPYAFAELVNNKPHAARYNDSKTLIDDVDRIEAILNDTHGLHVQLTDVLGKAMANRKVVVVKPKPPAPATTPPASPPSAAPASAAAAPAVAASTAPAASAPVSTSAGASSAGDTVSATAAATDPAQASADPSAPATVPPPDPAGATAGTAAATPDDAKKTSDGKEQAGQMTTAPAATADIDTQDVAQKVEWTAIEMMTDGNGMLPEITSATLEPFVVLIPRIEYKAYNDAVAKQQISELGNSHEISPRDGVSAAGDVTAPVIAPAVDSDGADSQKTDDQAAKPTTDAPPTQPAPAATALAAPAPPQPAPVAAPLVAVKKADVAVVKVPVKPPAPPPQVVPTISVEHAVQVVKEVLGWVNSVETSFSYIKHFYTRPKLPEKPLDPTTPTQKGATRVQQVGSSLKNADTKKTVVEDKVTTEKKTAEKKVEATGDAPWMDIAIQEQQLAPTSKGKKSHTEDPEWKKEHQNRTDAENAIKKDQAELNKEQSRKKPPPDAEKISALKADISNQEKNRDDADNKMLAIEKGIDDENIVKYLESTTLGRDMARNAKTFWCSSFVNWCVQKAKYTGTKNAMADSWLNWGEKIDEPRYGAITVVTRSDKPDYHVGFYLGIVKKQVPDGTEEVETKNKKGEIVKTTKKKMREIDVISLLSGNYSETVKEGHEWAVNPADNPRLHLVSYHWPTSAQKQPNP